MLITVLIPPPLVKHDFVKPSHIVDEIADSVTTNADRQTDGPTDRYSYNCTAISDRNSLAFKVLTYMVAAPRPLRAQIHDESDKNKPRSQNIRLVRG